MYQRTGWVVGNRGWMGALLIVTFANAITFLTALSMSALATNMKVGVGGAYYLISRTLGLEVGGAIGIPLYLSQALSLTLYAFGLAEILRVFPYFSDLPVGVIQGITGLIIVAVSVVAAKSTELALRLQLPIMALIVLSLISLFAGVDWGSSQVSAFTPEGGVGFWPVFAVFFPAVTGILAGVSLSGDLEDPAHSIPVGVLSAVAVGFVVYCAVPVALAFSAPAEALRDNQMIWTSVARWGFLVIPGMAGAILSSAIGSILAAPRTLQALAIDRLVPSFLGEVDPETGEPTNALWLTAAIALVAVLLGSLNSVALVLTMFFLTTYGTLNLVAAIESLVDDPSYRPRIHIPWWASFLGAVGCFVGMMLIHWQIAFVAIAVEVSLFWNLRRQSLKAAWGDVRSGIWLSLARYALLSLREARVEPRNWRPHILMFTADLSRTLVLAKFASDFSQQRGIVTINTLLIGDIDEHRAQADLLERNRALLESKAILAFPEVAAVPSFDAGVITVSQANGFAGLESNTVLFGWPGEKPEQLAKLVSLSRKLSGLEKCTLIARHVPGFATLPPSSRTIIVWWKGKEHNGDLMLLLAHLLTLSSHWSGASIVLKSIATDEETERARRREFAAMLPNLRMSVEVEVYTVGSADQVSQTIIERSVGASLVFLGLGAVEKGAELGYATQLVSLVRQLPTTVLVRNAGPFRGRLV